MLIYTDGVVESRNARDEEFGVERLTALCRAHSREDPDGLITTVLDEVRDWSTGLELLDDVTLFGLRIT